VRTVERLSLYHRRAARPKGDDRPRRRGCSPLAPAWQNAVMRTLHHLPLCPFARKVRILLAEMALDCELEAEPVWERRDGFLVLNPAGEVPVLVEEDGTAIVDSTVICEYLCEVYGGGELLGGDPAWRAEIRRIAAWFDLKFHREAGRLILDEKIDKRFLARGAPDSAVLRRGIRALRPHLDYLGWLTRDQGWLAGEMFTLADIAAAAHLSCIDYLGDVPWDDYPAARAWYARARQRPSMRAVLADHVPGLPPARGYRGGPG
jgi:glutathione S-transferase